ncbi:MAG: sigma-E factor negative regulatory protein, partial [Halorhodospira sp.]
MSQDDEHEQLGEQLSALVDGELSREERAFLLRRLGHDGAARARLGRYFLMRDALQRTLPAQPDPGLAGRVRARIAEEPAHDAGSAKARSAPSTTGWRRP